MTQTPAENSEQPIEDRVNNRSQRPDSEAFRSFMSSSWAPASQQLPDQAAVAEHAARRRRAISDQFKGERLVLPAGPLKVRSNDTDYMFRPHSAFAHLTGLGVDHEPDAVLVLEPADEGTGDDGGNHRATLYFRPLLAGTPRSSTLMPGPASSGLASAQPWPNYAPSSPWRPQIWPSWRWR